MIVADEVKQLVKEQLASIADELVRVAITTLLVEPYCQYRYWIPETETYPCWVVAEDREFQTSYVYCEVGLSPSIPWGIGNIFDLAMGMDSNWFDTLENAFYDSFAAVSINIWNVVNRYSADETRTIASSLTSTQAYELRNKLVAEHGSTDQVPYWVKPRTKRWW